MTDDRDRLIRALRDAVPPIGDRRPSGDLWPAVARRMHVQRARTPWLDWTLAAAVLIALFAWPGALPALLYLL